MDWIQFSILIASILGGTGFFWRELKRVEVKLDAQILEMAKRTDSQIQNQTMRSDRLYEMFVDLLKEVKK